jgi:plasmid stabilization system protein ParE
MAQSHQVILTITARKDINNILDYLLEKVSYSEAADARQKIIAAINSLTSMPEARTPVRETLKQNKPIIFRQIIAKEVYRIIYRIEDTKKNVVIIRVIHVKRGPGFVKKALR